MRTWGQCSRAMPGSHTGENHYLFRKSALGKLWAEASLRVYIPIKNVALDAL